MPPTGDVVLAGAAPDTGNLGVSALCRATVVPLARRLPGARVTVLDNGRGVRAARYEEPDGSVAFDRLGAVRTRRLHSGSSWARIRLAARLGGLANPGARRFRGADAVLDVSGGDSFTDLYGEWRFHSVLEPKRLALDLGVPLVLLPQTYGPFRDPGRREAARRIVVRARAAWARDARSHAALQELAGPDFDPGRHRAGVDVAFLLPVHPPADPLPEPVAGWLAEGRAAPTVGFNVSGLVLHDPEAARTRFGLRADYREGVLGFLRRVLERSDARVALVPHVLTPPGHPESDAAACEEIRAALGDAAAGRVAVVPARLDETEAKWVISRTDWFCGTRMHSTIAGLSTGVPTAAVAYSLKTQGVFETCGQGAHVADPRELGTEALVERLWESFTARDAARADLAARLPGVRAAAGAQMDAIAAIVRERATGDSA